MLYYTSIDYIPRSSSAVFFRAIFILLFASAAYYYFTDYIYIYTNGTPLKQLDEVLYDIYVLGSGLWPTRTKENRWKHLWKTNYIWQPLYTDLFIVCSADADNDKCGSYNINIKNIYIYILFTKHSININTYVRCVKVRRICRVSPNIL